MSRMEAQDMIMSSKIFLVGAPKMDVNFMGQMMFNNQLGLGVTRVLENTTEYLGVQFQM